MRNIVNKLFGKRKDGNLITLTEKEVTKKDQDKNEDINVKFPTPNICLVDVDSETANELITNGYKVKHGSLGTPVKLTNLNSYSDGVPCLPNYKLPDNLHEYNIVIVDIKPPDSIEYDPKDHTRKDTASRKEYYLVSRFPQKVFDPRPLSGSILKERFESTLKSGGILIAFIDSPYHIDYEFYEVNERKSENEKHNIFNFAPVNYSPNSKTGSEIDKIKSKHENIFGKESKNLSYNAVFDHPTEWNSSERQSEPRKDFHPILYNKHGEIISFLDSYGEGAILFLPQFENKGAVLKHLLADFLPQVLPKNFPFSQKNKWLNKDEYILPSESNINLQKESEIKKHKEIIIEFEKQFKEERQKNQWRYDLLTETDANLVSSVIKFLEWVGFENVKDMDENTKGRKEEDIQIEIEEKLLVLEVKGIHRTSSDSDCGQIDKIVRRRMKDSDSTKVHGFYLVNHQRALPPLDRENPPFTDDQIDDAIAEDRSMTTTWELFKVARAIDEGVLSKEDVKTSIINAPGGLIQFSPINRIHQQPIGEVYHGGKVLILNTDEQIRKNDIVFIDDQHGIRKSTIMKIQKEDIEKTSASGEIGVEINTVAKKGNQIFITRTEE